MNLLFFFLWFVGRVADFIPLPEGTATLAGVSHRWSTTMDTAARAEFLQRKEEERAEARQRAALQLLVGIDLDALFASPAEERSRISARLKRALERERCRGLRQHWSYDLNRHIALKQALDRLKEPGDSERRIGTRPTGRRRPGAHVRQAGSR